MKMILLILMTVGFSANAAVEDTYIYAYDYSGVNNSTELERAKSIASYMRRNTSILGTVLYQGMAKEHSKNPTSGILKTSGDTYSMQEDDGSWGLKCQMPVGKQNAICDFFGVDELFKVLPFDKKAHDKSKRKVLMSVLPNKEISDKSFGSYYIEYEDRVQSDGIGIRMGCYVRKEWLKVATIRCFLDDNIMWRKF